MVHKSRRTLKLTHRERKSERARVREREERDRVSQTHIPIHWHWRQSKETCLIFEFRSTVFHSIFFLFSVWVLCANTCFMYMYVKQSVYVNVNVCQARHFSNFHFYRLLWRVTQLV